MILSEISTAIAMVYGPLLFAGLPWLSAIFIVAPVANLLSKLKLERR